MMRPTKMRRGLILRLYLGISHLFPLIATRLLHKRRARGKEHATRWIEKQGKSLAPRPEDTLIWLNAVGLGEVLSLRGLIARMSQARPDLSFLVTSTTSTSAKVFDQNLPARTIHQFLPIDAPLYRHRFLDHFQPDLCIWAEQDIWPGFVSDLAKRHIPQAVVAARMSSRSFRSHRRAKGLYRDLYQTMHMVTVQDDTTAQHLRELGAIVRVTGSLKPAAPQLDHDGTALALLSKTLQGRKIWAVAPSHAEDEAIAIAAQKIVLKCDPTALLIIAPRFPDRYAEILQTYGQVLPRKSQDEVPQHSDPIWVCDTFGDLGLIYRLSSAVLIGGTFGATQGHNPWEAAALKTALLHGPDTANFALDFEQLTAANAAIPVKAPEDVAAAILRADLPGFSQNAVACMQTASAQTDALATDLLALLDTQ